MIAVALLLLLPAQPEGLQSAKKLFERASAAYEKGEFTAAIGLFEEAYAMAPRPQIAFSLGQAYRRQAATEIDPLRRRTAIENAMRSYRQYLDLAPQGSRRSHAEQFIAQLEQFLDYTGRANGPASRTELIVMSNVSSGIVSIDGRPISLMTPIEVAPGKHVVAVEAPGYFTYRNETTVPEGRLLSVDAELRPKPSVIRVDAPAGSEIAIDGRPQGLAPLPLPLEVNAGRHFLTVSDRGAYPFARELDLGIGEDVRVIAELEVTMQRIVAYIMLAASGAMALGAIGSAVLALASEREALEISTRRMQLGLTTGEVDRYNDLLIQRERAIGAAIGIGTAAGISAAIGVLLFVFDNPKVPSSDIRF